MTNRINKSAERRSKRKQTQSARLLRWSPTPNQTGCLTLYWVLLSPQGRLLHCGLYQVELDYEVRVGFGVEPPRRTERVSTTDAAAICADKLKNLALSIGYLERNQSSR